MATPRRRERHQQAPAQSTTRRRVYGGGAGPFLRKQMPKTALHRPPLGSDIADGRDEPPDPEPADGWESPPRPWRTCLPAEEPEKENENGK